MTAISWKSGVSGLWTLAADWNPAIVPGAGDDVAIGVGGSYIVSVLALPLPLGSLTISDPNAILAIDGALGNVGGSNVAITGTLANSGHIEIGNPFLTLATTVTVGSLANTGEVDLTGSATAQATLLVDPAGGTLTGKYILSGDALLACELGGVTAIGTFAELSLTGSQARVALGSAPDSSSALTQLGSNLGTFRLENGATVATSVDFLNNGIVDIDDALGSGGNRVSFGGILTNRGNLVIGNSLLTTATTVTATDLVNAREIDLTGSGATQATLDIAAAAPATFTGINKLSGDALMEYGSGAINNIVIGSLLSLNGPNARIALAATPGSNSAMTALKGNAGTFDLENGAVVAIGGGFTNTGLTEIDTGPSAGGSSLKIDGILTNSAIISPNGVKIGNLTLGAATIVTAAGLLNTGETDVTGNLSVQATLDVTGGAAPTLDGRMILTNDALLEYGSGAIITIDSGAELFLNGANARVALASATGSSSALTLLASNLGSLRLDSGAAVTITKDFLNSGLVEIDDLAGSGRSRLTIGGTLTNNASGVGGLKVGSLNLGSPTSVSAAELANTGEIDLIGAPSVQATLDIAAAAPDALTGVINLTNDALLEYGGGAITEISSGSQLALNGAEARVALSSGTGSNSALRTLAGNDGTLRIENGEVLSTSKSFVNSGRFAVDDFGGESRLTMGGALTNQGVMTIGNAVLSATTLATAAGLTNTGEIDITGARSVQATFDIAAAAPSTLTGKELLTNDALLEYASGKITAIESGSELSLNGISSRVAIASGPNSNSALTRLATNNGILALAAAAAVATAPNFSNTGSVLVDSLGAGGSSLKIGGALANRGTVDIGNNRTLSQVTTVIAAGLDNLSGGSLVIAGYAAPATLALTGAATNEGSITIDSHGVLSLGKGLGVASAGVLAVNGGEISGGTLSGSGTMDSAAGSSSTLDGVTIAAGASFAAGVGSLPAGTHTTLTLDHVTVAGALLGGGSAGLVFGVPGNDAMTGISGFPTISLADGGKNMLSLKAPSFAGVTGGAITIYDGDGGGTVTASSLPALDAVIVHAGGGSDKLTGGAGNDVFFAGGKTTMTGKTGANKFVFYGPGPAHVIADFAASAQNEIVFSNFGFSLGQSGASATPGQLPGNLFVENATGKFTGTAQRFAYDTANGKLFFAADGSGSTPELVATLTGHPGLSAAQLFFVT